MRICDFYSFLAPTIRKCANAQLRANLQIWKILASRRLGTKSPEALPLGVWTLIFFPEDEPPLDPVMFCRPPRRRGRHSVRSNTKDGDLPNYSTELCTIDAASSPPLSVFTYPQIRKTAKGRWHVWDTKCQILRFANLWIAGAQKKGWKIRKCAIHKSQLRKSGTPD